MTQATEADRGLVRAIALALVNERRRFSGFSPYESLDELPEHHYRDQIRYARAAIAVLPARHRTASTAALTAEVERKVRHVLHAVACDAAEEKFGNSAAFIMNRSDLIAKRIAAALSTPSEVSEPVADEGGGDVELEQLRDECRLRLQRDAADWPEVGDEYLAALQRQVDATKPANFKLTDLANPPNTTNGDAVREALARIDKFVRDFREPWGSWKTAWWEDEVSDNAAFTADNALMHVANIASAALNHGGTQG